MASGPTRMQVLSMYKSLVREANKLPSYIFRCLVSIGVKSYALRRVRHAFDDNKNVTDPKQIQKLYEFAQDNLELIRRQAVIQHLYQADKLIIEKKEKAVE